jgi:hypothetical protein
MRHKQYFVSRHIWKSLLDDNFPQQQLSVVILSNSRPNPIFRKKTDNHTPAYKDKTLQNASY